MGFEVQRYGPAQYGFASRDGIEPHLGHVPDSDQHTGPAYVFVDDSDAVAAQWPAAGAEVHGPQDTDTIKRGSNDRNFRVQPDAAPMGASGGQSGSGGGRSDHVARPSPVTVARHDRGVAEDVARTSGCVV